ncbi:MAG: nucleoside triphosphate pyrophosphohydrolase [Candidatus Aminicenantes bacterium]|nr:MAG: nucleoside triphosphate pyrophosphohydrolase [Candidatus Aminicenantes bacterium]
MKEAETAGKKFEQLIKILDTLRGEHGCPWDKEQDEKSISNYFLEEVYEALDAITSKDAKTLAEELGDVLMEVVFLARIYKEKREFTITDVLEGINQKMIRRHPHVFGEKLIRTSKRVLDEWQRQKKEEKERQSLLDGISDSSPSLLAAFHIGLSVSSYGFDWKQPQQALQKVKEEVSELERALEEKKEEEVFRELGDIFFSMVNVSRLLGINPEIALRGTNKKFIKRFKFIEERLKERGRELGQATLEEMDEIWEEAKEKIR